MAMLTDLLVISAANRIIGLIRDVFVALDPDTAQAVEVLLYFLVMVLYAILCELLLNGQTLGKRIFKLRVVDASGLRLEPSQVIIRNLLRLVDGLPMFYLLGGITCLLNTRMQRLGDIAASTVVVRIPEVSHPDLDNVLGSKYNSLLEHRHLCARLRQRVTPEVAAIALEALTRRDRLDPVARLKVFAGLAAHFRELVDFPAAATESLGDEQYVRNVVEILYRAG
ncbi:hypothetical protein F183_A22290 [Bryobacterales bacterium F-183]|nr:hypothetical protein F183_A22290 [Bryobacterales bacterium F-183]